MNAAKPHTHFVETRDANGQRTVEVRTYPVQARRPQQQPTAKKLKLVSAPVTKVVKTIVTNAQKADALAHRTSVAPTKATTVKVEQPVAEHTSVPVGRVVETVMVKTGTLDKYVGCKRWSRWGKRNGGRKPRAKYRPDPTPKPPHPLDLGRVMSQPGFAQRNRYGRWGIIGDGVE